MSVTMKSILCLLLIASVANAKYLRRTQESKLFHFIPAVPFLSASEGIVAEPSSEGTDNLSQLKSGDVIQYPMEIPVEESYLLQVRLASPDGGGRFTITNADTGEVLATFEDLPASGNWQRYKPISRFVTLPAGSYTLSVNVEEQGFNLLWMYFKQQDGTLAPATTTMSPASPPVATPATMAPVATPVMVPVGSPVTSPVSSPTIVPGMTPVAPPVLPPVSVPTLAPVPSSEFVPDEVDKWTFMVDAADFFTMQGVEVETSPEGIGIVGFLDPGDYVEYMVDFPMVGKYKVSMNVASPDGEGAFEVDVGSQRVVAFVDGMPVTSAWESFETVAVQMEVTTTGLQPLRINILAGGFNLHWIYFYHDMAHDCAPTPAPTVLKESSTHDCEDETAVPVPVVPEPTPEPTSAPTECHNSTMEMGK
jgi:hypothetical protein